MTASDPQKIEAAARDFAAATAAALKLPTGWHPPTVITACARMAGTYLFRSFGLALSTVSPGQVVLSPAASHYAPALIQYMATVLQGLSVDIASEPPSEAARGAAKSMREFLDTQRLIEPLFAPIQTKHGLTTVQSANGAAAATAVLIFQFAKNFDPNLGFWAATYGITEGSKTAPDPVNI